MTSTPIVNPDVAMVLRTRLESLETKLTKLETTMAAEQLKSLDLNERLDTMRNGTILRIKNRLNTLEKVKNLNIEDIQI